VALVPTLLAIGIGLGLGLHWGGQLSNLLEWPPPLWQAVAGGVALGTEVDAPAQTLLLAGVAVSA